MQCLWSLRLVKKRVSRHGLEMWMLVEAAQFGDSMTTTTTVTVKLSRSNRIYRSSEPVEGKIVIKSPNSISHQAIRLSVNGSVNLQVRGGSAGVIESFYGVIKPIQIV